MSENAKKPRIRFKGFSDAWEQRKLSFYLETSTIKNTDNVYGIDDVLSVSGDYGVVNQIEFQGRSFAGASVQNYGILDTNDIVYTKSPLKANPYGIIKTNKGKTGIVSVLYGVFHPKDNTFPPFIQTYFEQNARLNNYLRPLVNKGAKNTLLISDDESINGFVSFPQTTEEQVYIGKLFDRLDNLITLHQRKYDKLVSLKKALLEKMFPADGETVPKIRFKGFSDAWEQRKFEEIAIRSSVQSANKDLPRIEYEDIVSGSGELNKDVFQKERTKVGIEFQKGDILYGKLRPYLKNWLLPDFSGLAVGDFWVLQPQNVDSGYLFRLIQSRKFEEVANQSTGTKMPRADWKLVSKTEFYLPTSSDEQKQIGEYFRNLDNLITLHQRQLEKLKNIKSALLEKMFV